MKAVFIREHGLVSGWTVTDIPVPSLGPDEVLVRVQASGINPSDLASAAGMMPHSVLPRVIGRDFAGVVAQGPKELLGAEVWGTGGDLGISRDGTHAEYLAIPQLAVARRPKNLSAEEAAIAGLPFVTAWSALVDRGKVKEGDWVIVSGAAGAVGQAALQLAHAYGARVIALVKDASELWVQDSVHVDAIAQSDRADLAIVVNNATNGKGAQLALNAIGASILETLFGALGVQGRQVVYSAAGGRESMIDILTFYQNERELLGLTTQPLDVIRCSKILNRITPLFESGLVLPPKVGERYPLADAPTAYGRVATHQGGKIVLQMLPDVGGSTSSDMTLVRSSVI
jgi:NADPH2:quinone reductase